MKAEKSSPLSQPKCIINIQYWKSIQNPPPTKKKTTSLHVDWEHIKNTFFFPFSLDALPKVTCPNHPDAILVEDYRAGDMICPECGLVVGKQLWF